jgi:hypothetical protein
MTNYSVELVGDYWNVNRDGVVISTHTLRADADAAVQRYRCGLMGFNAISGDVESRRSLKLHFDHDVTDDDRRELVEAINAYNAAKINPVDKRMTEIIATLARMDTPTDGITDQDQADEIMADLDDERLCSDASALYELIRAARKLLP